MEPRRIPDAGADPPTDACLLTAAESDPGAFRALYDRHADRVFVYFRNRGVDHHNALDLTGETFAEAWHCRHRYRDPGDGAVGPWLFGIARHLLSHARRRYVIATAARERLGLLEEATPHARSESDLDAVIGFEPHLDRSLQQLNPETRRLVELRVMHQQSYDEIAVELDCTPLAARIRLSRALQQLRADLGNSPMEELR